MKKKIALACVLLIVLAAGCNQKQIEEIQSAVIKMQDISVKADREIALITESIAILRTEIAENLTLTAEQKVEIEKTLQEATVSLDEWLALKADADNQIVIFKEALEQAKTQSAGEQIEAGGNYLQNLAATALPPGVREWVALIGIFGTAIGGAWVKRERTKTATANNETKEQKSIVADIVGTVGELLKSDVVADKDAARKILKKQKDPTRAAVRNIVKKGG